MKKIGFIAFDSTRPNLALGKLYGYHKEKGDLVIFPWNGQRVNILYVSIIFTKSKQKLLTELPLYERFADEVIIGGTGWDLRIDLPANIQSVSHKYLYEMYPNIEYGYGFTVRGCSVGCPFCMVWRKEGLQETRVTNLRELVNPKFFERDRLGKLKYPTSDHVVLLNNNSFASDSFFDDIEEAKELNVSLNWNQANDITLLTEEHARALKSIRYSNQNRTRAMLHFSWDQMIKRKKDASTGGKITYNMKEVVTEKVKMLNDFGIPSSHLTFYTLIGFDTSLEEDLERHHVLHSLGVHQYAMQHDNIEGKGYVDSKGNRQSPHVKAFRHWVNGYAFRNVPFHQFDRFEREMKKLGQPEQTALF